MAPGHDPFAAYGQAICPEPQPSRSEGEIVADFIAAMEAGGVPPAEPIADILSKGELVRFQVQGDRKGRRNGWAVLHLDGRPAGAFGNNKGGQSATWSADRRPRRLTSAELAEQRQRIAAAKKAKAAEIEAAQLAAADTARSWWSSSAPADPSHPYLAGKGIPGEGVRQRFDKLLVPMVDIDGVIWNAQRIAPDKTKLFLKGARVSGLMWRCGEPDAVICIGEGFGTMARVRKATGHAVVAAFTEKNLEPVARLVRDRYPDLDLIICADDDAHLVEHPLIHRNVGLDAAHAAAAAVGGRVAVPPRGE